LKQVSGLRHVSGLLTTCPFSVITQNFSIDNINKSIAYARKIAINKLLS
jgi:hypothetical protein